MTNAHPARTIPSRAKALVVYIMVAIFMAFTLMAPPGLALQAAPVEVPLAADGKALMPVVVAEGASESVRKSAASLAEYLGKIAGATFEVQAGDGTTGIAVGTVKDFPSLQLGELPDPEKDSLQREDYLLRSHEQGVYVIGATDLAVQHAVWDMLYRLGYRQFFPGKHWEVVPSVSPLGIAIDVREHPDYVGRQIWYGFGNWPSDPPDKSKWDARNRMANGVKISAGHAYDSIYKARKAEFDAHPEYFCSTKPVKFCISNPDLRKLVVDWAVAHFDKNPKADSVSLDPSDGGGWECPRCEAEFKSVSDRVVTLANEVAEAVNQRHKNKYIAIYAYYQHSPPPSIKIHPNVAALVATSFIRGGYTVDQLLSGWSNQGALVGIREYYSVVVGHKDRPGGPGGSNPRAVAAAIVHRHKQGARFTSAESSDSWGPLGLSYYLASRMLWNVEEDPEAVINDFMEKSFGPAQGPMREFYDLIDRRNRPLFTRDLIGRMYRHLDAARKLTDDPGVRGRLDDLVLYTRYVELLLALEVAEDKMAATGLVLGHAYRIRDTHMVHSYAMWRDTRGGFARPTGDTVWSVPEGKNPWKSSEPLSPGEIESFIQAGIEANQLLAFQPAQFSTDLVPAAGKLNLKSDGPGGYGYTRKGATFYLWLDAPGTVKLTLTGGQIAPSAQSTVTLYAEENPTLEAVSTASAPNDKQPHEVELKSTFSGLHRITIADSGRGVGLVWAPGTKVTIPSSEDARILLRHRWSMYFYVPKGTEVIGGYAGGHGGLLDGDGKPVEFNVPDGRGYFAVPVPEGQDGKLWKFTNSVGERLLMTVPPYLARSGDELLLPKEVIEADASDQ